MSSALENALHHATDTKLVVLESGGIRRTAKAAGELFGARQAIIVADANTFGVAGPAVAASFSDSKHVMGAPLVLENEIHAEYSYVERIEAHLRAHDAVPIAVGSGVINDLVKLAAHRVGRPYLCVATAASMDGYTAFGASITHQGDKRTFSCPAPAGVIADLNVICAAPPELNAAGYADLMAKVTAGADWIVADVLGVEPIDQRVWDMVQAPLATALENPAGIKTGDRTAITLLMEGLLLSGFAMQAHKTSRPASGAEHQFSHLWDMEDATDASHGFKVGVATVAVARFYEALLAQPLEVLDASAAAQRWPETDQVKQTIARRFDIPAIKAKALEETLAKQVDRAAVARELAALKETLPTLRDRVGKQLPGADRIARMLAAAGAPTRCEEIGIPVQRLRSSFLKAYHIRRRFTVLDLAARAGLLEQLTQAVAL